MKLPRFVKYCMGRVNMLRSCNVTPILVFDGASIKMKEEEESHRDRFQTLK